MLLGYVARRIKKHDRIAKRIEHKRNGDCEHADPAADQNEASPFAGHDSVFTGVILRQPSRPRSFIRSSIRLASSGRPLSARLASAAASLALSRSPSTT